MPSVRQAIMKMDFPQFIPHGRETAGWIYFQLSSWSGSDMILSDDLKNDQQSLNFVPNSLEAVSDGQDQ